MYQLMLGGGIAGYGKAARGLEGINITPPTAHQGTVSFIVMLTDSSY
jgi:hypothetical protein